MKIISLALVTASIGLFSCKDNSKTQESGQQALKSTDSLTSQSKKISDTLFWGFRFGMTLSEAKKQKIKFTQKNNLLVGSVNLNLFNSSYGKYTPQSTITLEFLKNKLSSLNINVPAHTSVSATDRKGWQYTLGTNDVLPNLKSYFDNLLKNDFLESEDADGFIVYHLEDKSKSFRIYSQDWDIGSKMCFIIDLHKDL